MGQEISNRTYVLDAGMISKYVEAVGDQSGIHDPSDERAVVPAMALAALGLGGVVGDLGIPSGTVHVGQELEFSGVARVGDELTFGATLAQNSVRRGSRFVGVRLWVRDGAGKHIMAGKSTMVMPA